MPSCECCYARSGGSYDDYLETLGIHLVNKCVCTKETIEGKRARAGQWWDEERQVDTREDGRYGHVHDRQRSDD